MQDRTVPTEPIAAPKPLWRRVLLAPLTVALAVGAVFALVEPVPLDQVLRQVQTWAMPLKASGEIVIVDADWSRDPTIQTPADERLADARLLRALKTYQPKRVFVEKPYFQTSTTEADSALAATLSELPVKPVLASKIVGYSADGAVETFRPITVLARTAQIADTSYLINPFGWTDQAFRTRKIDNQLTPSFAALLANRRISKSSPFAIELRIRPASISTVEAHGVTAGRVSNDQLQSKVVVVAGRRTTSDLPRLPVYGVQSQVVAHVLAAETLMRGDPKDYGPWPLLALIAVGGVFTTLLHFRRRSYTASRWVGVVAVLTAAAVARLWLVNLDVTPALAAILTIAITANWQARKRRAERTNARSGLPNMAALRAATGHDGSALVVARIARSDEIMTVVPAEHHGDFARAVAARLSPSVDGPQIHHDESGHFAWFVAAENLATLEEHLSGLKALFATPVTVGEATLDLSINFGTDRDPTRPVAERLAGCLDAAAEAAERGLLVLAASRQRAEQARWRASLHTAIDAALRNGEIWVAYQPKLDLTLGRVVGAEALVRWTHPERGAIAPDEFIAHAERDERIDALTWAVMDRAVDAAARLAAAGAPLHMAVNLSAVLLSRVDLLDRVSAVLSHHRLPPDRLTLELTETVPLGSDPLVMDNLTRLRAAGVRISIDDYGMGSSNLLYMRNVPSDEIKIDRTFITDILTNPADRAIVRGTVAMARELGRTVVAEGVEHRSALPVLQSLGCDQAQGYAIARPQHLSDLWNELVDGAPGHADRIARNFSQI